MHSGREIVVSDVHYKPQPQRQVDGAIDAVFNMGIELIGFPQSLPKDLALTRSSVDDFFRYQVYDDPDMLISDGAHTLGFGRVAFIQRCTRSIIIVPEL
jgi:hypothetical protein